MDANSTANSVVYAVLLCLLGLLMGATLAFLLLPYVRWVDRREHPLPSSRRLWVHLFVFAVGAPVAVIPAYMAGVTLGLPSDLGEGELYFVAYIGGFFATLGVCRYWSRRRSRSGRGRR